MIKFALASSRIACCGTSTGAFHHEFIRNELQSNGFCLKALTSWLWCHYIPLSRSTFPLRMLIGLNTALSCRLHVYAYIMMMRRENCVCTHIDYLYYNSAKQPIYLHPTITHLFSCVEIFIRCPFAAKCKAYMLQLYVNHFTHPKLLGENVSVSLCWCLTWTWAWHAFLPFFLGKMMLHVVLVVLPCLAW